MITIAFAPAIRWSWVMEPGALGIPWYYGVYRR